MSATASYSPAYAAIVVDAKTGAVLHEAAPDGRRHPASLTKIMTLYLLFERLEAGKIALDTEMPVSEEAAAQAPTKLGVRAGQTLKVADAIGGLVTKSANDAAVVVAEALSGGTQRDFAEMMTNKARALGMSQSMATKHMAALEGRLGVRLLHRSTRRITLTEAGQRYLESAERILEELDRSDAAAAAEL